jgi:hypothetical protein
MTAEQPETKPNDAVDIAHALHDIESVNSSVVELLKTARDVLEQADAKITDDAFAAGKLWEFIPATLGTPMVVDTSGTVIKQGVSGNPEMWQKIDQDRYNALRMRIELLRALLQTVTESKSGSKPSFASLLREQSSRWSASR